jgi:hypothetical protein
MRINELISENKRIKDVNQEEISLHHVEID